MRLIIISGNLAKDPETRQTQNGKTFCMLRIVNNRKTGNKDDTMYLNVMVFGKTSESCAQYLRKGSGVIVTGTPTLESYQGRDGKLHTEMQVTANTVDFTSTANNGSGQYSDAQQPYNGGYAQQQPPQQPYYGQQQLPQQPPMNPPAEGPQPPVEDSPF